MKRTTEMKKNNNKTVSAKNKSTQNNNEKPKPKLQPETKARDGVHCVPNMFV